MPGPIARDQFQHQVPGAVAKEFQWHSETLTASLTLDETYPNKLRLDPGGSARDVTLPAEATSTGVEYHIVNSADGAENLVVKDDGASTIGTLNQNEEGIFFCDGSSWTLIRIATIALS